MEQKPKLLYEDILGLLEFRGIKQGKIMQAMRLALTGSGTGPDLMLTMEIIGRPETLVRLEQALKRLG